MKTYYEPNSPLVWITTDDGSPRLCMHEEDYKALQEYTEKKDREANAASINAHLDKVWGKWFI